MTPLRILQVTPYYEDAWGYGGIPRVATHLCRALAARGHQVTVCTTDARDEHQRCAGPGIPGRFTHRRPWQYRSSGVEVCVFANISNALAYRQQFFVPLGLRDYLDRQAGRFDVAHIHGYHHLLGVHAAKALRRHNIPYLLMPNGTLPRIERRRVAKWIFDTTFGRGVLPGAARLLAVTQAERRALQRAASGDQAVDLVPNPIDLREFVPLPSPSAFRSRVKRACREWIVFLGRLSPRKGVATLVRAFAALDRPHSGLMIAGNDMGVAASCRRLARRLGVADRVGFLGLLAGRAWLEALVAADVVAYAGRDEIFGLVPLEAIMCGTPVVVGSDSGCGEVISQVGGGLAVEVNNVAVLAEALGKVLSHRSAWQEAAGRAQAMVRRRFGCDEVAQRCEAIYAAVAGAPK